MMVVLAAFFHDNGHICGQVAENMSRLWCGQP